MLTRLTHIAIALLQSISTGTYPQPVDISFSDEEQVLLLNKLTEYGLIHPVAIHLNHPNPSNHTNHTASTLYKLARPLSEISLLEVLEATGEPFNCSRPTKEALYFRNRRVARKLGVLNDTVRIFCMDIKLSDW